MALMSVAGAWWCHWVRPQLHHAASLRSTPRVTAVPGFLSQKCDLLNAFWLVLCMPKRLSALPDLIYGLTFGVLDIKRISRPLTAAS